MSTPKAKDPFAALKELKAKLAEEEALKNKTAEATQAKQGSPQGGKATRPAQAPIASKGSAYTPPKQKTTQPKVTPEEEAFAFARLIAGVTPLEEGKHRHVGKTANAEKIVREKPSDQRDDVNEHLRQLVEGGAKFEVRDDGSIVEGRRLDIPHEHLRKLRHGQFPIDAKLDLHGRTEEEAKKELALFVRANFDRRERCLLIIHGKGEHSVGGQGILRGEISVWLSQGASSACVAAFCSAPSELGGPGAVTVLLRRPGL